MYKMIGQRNLSIIQRSILTVGCGVVAVTNPYRYDCVAYATEATAAPCQLTRLSQRIQQTAEGQTVLQEKPNIHSSTVDLDALKLLPQETFGKQYSDMLERHKISPDTRVPVKFIDGEDHRFIMQRYRQVHDLLHLLLNAPTNFEGEAAVKAFEFAQTGMAVPLIGATAAPLYRLDSTRWARHQSRLGKLLKTSSNDHPHYLSVYYEQRWDQELDTLRTELGIPNLF